MSSAKTLLTWPDLRSGSKVNKEQYLLYRVLLPDYKEPEFLNPLRFGIPTILITQAQNVLYKIQTYQLYMKMLGNDNWTDPVMGSSGSVRLQTDIGKGWHKNKKMKMPGEDTVISVFLELLNSLTSTIFGTNSHSGSGGKFLV
ncbi:hypothetical protein BO83DRAFT_393826 [Aspergillus eucalypticola CBS 122712]|uniref:Uncharacterized protein n=1 Tax=Aspergillus eucalypticola (strain CBS 122712 / IBT 29274) TaxID=1448314 RepID=A0A317UM04_ASPEC|nr:uncharacterized protein BO83DRAFT_393826 [Aspergillus eucalypticola CBS 122712]PWY62731.1 hypothetical protein BO83DRAFT_393826 [Aspergillus eucalypticola CBS 122712]